MKKSGIFCIFMAVILIISTLMPVFAETGDQSHAIESDISVASGSHSIDASVPVLGSDQLIENTTNVFLYEANTDTVLYAWNADEPVHPASFVKIMTALVAIEHGKLTDVVSVKEETLNGFPKDSVSAELKPNELITLEDLLYCMIVGSANDAASVIAEHISGSQEAFVAEMNRCAVELGCTGTKFTNAHGLHDENQITTARDSAKILRAALEKEAFYTIFTTPRYSTEATNLSPSRYLSTSNYLVNREMLEIYYDSRVIGGRTGNATGGERCLASVAEDDGLLLISIVMGSKSTYEADGVTVINFGSFNETRQLLNLAFNEYAPYQVLYNNQSIARRSVVNGENDVILGPKESLYTSLPKDATLSDLEYRYFDENVQLEAPILKGQKLSNVEVWYNKVCVAKTDLFALNDVRIMQINDSEETADSGSGIGKTILLLTLIAIAVLVIVLFGYRISNKLRISAARKRSRRYRKNRRRSR